MQGPLRTLAALMVGLCLVISTGCAQTAEGTTRWISKLTWNRPPEQLRNIKTPADHIKELAELRKTAKKKSPEEQQRITAELAKEIQRENEPLMRRHILRTLTVYPTPMAGAVLSAALGDGDVEVRRIACECLGQRGDKESIAELSRVLSSETNLDVRLAAVRAMGLTHESAALLPLSEALADPDPAMQAHAAESLRNVSGHDFGTDAQAWSEYAKTGHSSAPEPSLAERMRRMLY